MREKLLHCDAGAPSDHSAADIEPHRVRNHLAAGRKDATYRHPEAHVRIGHERDVTECERQIGEVSRLRHGRLVDVIGP